MAQDGTDGLAGGAIPESDGLVPAPGGDDLAIGAESQARDAGLMPEGWDPWFPGREVPKPDAAVLTADQDGLAIGAEPPLNNAGGIRNGVAERCECRRIPQPKFA